MEQERTAKISNPPPKFLRKNYKMIRSVWCEHGNHISLCSMELKGVSGNTVFYQVKCIDCIAHYDKMKSLNVDVADPKSDTIQSISVNKWVWLYNHEHYLHW